MDGTGNLYVTQAGNHRVFKIGTNVVPAAGTGSGGFSGDGGPATSATLNSPTGVAVDSLGNLYIADTLNSRIRKVGQNGIITTVAGNGLYKFGGDGGEAQSARLNSPQAVAADALGDLYIADSNNNRIRSITAGIINTFAGSGVYGFSGDGGAATSARLRHPGGVAADGVGSALNLYIADSESNRIRKVNPSLILTTALAGVEFPSGVAVDAAGSLFLAETGKNLIRKFGLDGSISTVAGNGSAGFAGDGGPASFASLNGPLSVALDRAGNLYIADTGNHRVRKVEVGGRITTVAGNGVADYSGEGETATGASLNFPSGVAVDSRGLLYIADRANHRVRRVNPDGRIATVAGSGDRGISGDGGAATLAALNTPIGLAFDAADNLYIADTGNDRIRKVVTFPPSDVPVFSARAVANGASFVSGATPGGIVTIFGTGLTKGVNGVVSAAGIPLPTELRGTRVKVNQIYAPLFSISNVDGQEQINLQLPFEFEGQSAVTLTVENNGVIGSLIRVKLQGVLPGIFTLDGQTGAILHGASSQFVLPSNPAARNEIVILYATGLGPVNPTPASGAPASTSPLSRAVFSPTATVGGINTEVLFSGLAPGFVGLYQVNIRVPATAPSGNVDVVIQSGGVTGSAVKMAVQ